MSTVIALFRALVDERRDLDFSASNAETIRHLLDGGLGPLGYYVSQYIPGQAVSTTTLASLQGAELTARLLTAGLHDALGEVFCASPNLAAQVTLLKGISSSQLYYPAPHLRTMGDIDLLVPKEKKAELEALLQQLGYQQRSWLPPSYYDDHHHSMPFYHIAKQVWIEVHTSLINPISTLSGDEVFAQNNVSANLQPMLFRGIQTNRMSDELQLVYTSSRWADELDPVRGLHPMLDVLLLLQTRHQAMDWDKVIRWLQHSSAAARVHLLLTYLVRTGLVALPQGIAEKITSASHPMGRINTALLHRLITTYLMKGKPFGRILTKNNVGIIWDTLLRPQSGWRNLLSLPAALLFPPGDAQRFSGRLFWRRLRSAITRRA